MLRIGKRKNDSNRFKIGDAVVVKPDVQCPDDPDISLAGWQGRVTEVDEETLLIEWDSLTLRAIPEAFIRECEEEGLDWTAMQLEANGVASASPRDTAHDVEQTCAEIASYHAWDHLSDEHPSIRKALAGVDPQDTAECLEAWEEHLQGALQFPFEAEIVELLQRGPLRLGERVQVDGIEMTDGLRGLIVRVRRGRQRFDFPLCDLEATEQKSPNYQALRAYVVWYANH